MNGGFGFIRLPNNLKVFMKVKNKTYDNVILKKF